MEANKRGRMHGFYFPLFFLLTPTPKLQGSAITLVDQV